MFAEEAATTIKKVLEKYTDNLMYVNAMEALE